MFRAVKQGAFAGSDIASDEREIAGHAVMYRSEPGEAGAAGSNPARSTEHFIAELLVVSFLFAALIIYSGALANVVAGWFS
jgi:hypothetical protein